ncbi:MAG: glycosyltransferase 87 family protein [Candidatus Aminicenantales bacterium]
MTAKRVLKWLLVSLILLFFLGLLVLFVSWKHFYQWDFKTFYYAAKAQAAGLNPYGVTSLAQVAKRPVRFNFRYPPLTLWFFRLFSPFNLTTAYYLFLALKCCLLGVLFFVWKKFFLKKEADIWFYPFSLLAFNTSIFIDLASGNISIMEQFCLWLGFVCLFKRRLLLFCFLVLVVANFKITPLFFLVLLLVLDEEKKKKFLYFFGTLAAFGLIQALSYLTSPLYKDFLFFNRRLETGFGNPSSFSFLRDLVAGLAHLTGRSTFSILHIVVYGLFAGAILLISWRAVATLKSFLSLSREDREIITILLACLAYAVTVPRFMAYSQIILIVPAYFAMKKFLKGTEGLLLFILVALQTPQHAGMPVMDAVLNFVWTYFSVLIGLGIWCIFVYRILEAKKGGTEIFVQSSSR